MIWAGVALLFEGYYSTGTKNLVIGILLSTSGLLILFGGPWGALAGLIIAIVALIVDLIWDFIAWLFGLEDPEPDFDSESPQKLHS